MTFLLLQFPTRHSWK